MERYYKIAGLSVVMDSYGRTVEQAVPYLSDFTSKPDIQIKSEWLSLKEKYPMLSDNEGEYLATGKSFYQQLLNYDGIMLHASAVVIDERAYLFSAPSGTGKSTHTQLWLKLWGNKAYILNDDKPALRLKNGVWYAYGTPWSGKHDISVNTGVPVAGIALLERNVCNTIEPYYGKGAVFSIYMQTNRKTETVDFRTKQLELLDKLITKVPIWKLKCNTDLEAAIIAYEAMSGKKMEVFE